MRHLSIIGMPMSYGQTKLGVDLGPRAIRYAGVVEKLSSLVDHVDDLGDISISQLNSSKNEHIPNLKNIHIIVENVKQLAEAVDKIIQKGSFPLILGGDHSISMGTLAGVAKHYKNLGVIWFDAHGDINTDKTTPSGNIHGMPLAASLGYGHPLLTNVGGFHPKIKAENVVIIGARDLDDGEKQLIKDKNILIFTIRDIDRLGMATVMKETIKYLKKKTDGVHLSFDLDGIDPNVAPGVGTPVPGGVTYRESQLAMEMLADAGIITSADFVEVNPLLDVKNKTANLAVELMGTLFGEKLI